MPRITPCTKLPLKNVAKYFINKLHINIGICISLCLCLNKWIVVNTNNVNFIVIEIYAQSKNLKFKIPLNTREDDIQVLWTARKTIIIAFQMKHTWLCSTTSQLLYQHLDEKKVLTLKNYILRESEGCLVVLYLLL